MNEIRNDRPRPVVHLQGTPHILNVHNLDNAGDYSHVGVVASVDTALVVVGEYLREGEETSTAWKAGVQGMPRWSRIPVTYIDGMVVVVAVAGTSTAFGVRTEVEVGRMVGAVMSRMRIGTSQIIRDWHMDLKVVSTLRTSCVAAAAAAEEYKRQDAEVEQEARDSCMMYVVEVSLVAVDGSSRFSNSSKQMTPRRKTANGAVVEQEEGVAS